MAIPDLQTLPTIPLPDSLDPPSPVIIERVRPEIDGGRYHLSLAKARVTASS